MKYDTMQRCLHKDLFSSIVDEIHASVYLSLCAEYSTLMRKEYELSSRILVIL